MVTNVTSLLKTVKAVEDEATKGTRALEATIEHIKQELAVSNYTCYVVIIFVNIWSKCFFSSGSFLSHSYSEVVVGNEILFPIHISIVRGRH